MKGTKNLTQGPILKQLFTLAMPIMATSFIQMAYSLTDMAWVGRIGKMYLQNAMEEILQERKNYWKNKKEVKRKCVKLEM